MTTNEDLMDAAMSLNSPFSKNAQNAPNNAKSAAPALPAHMASARQHTADEVLAMMNSTPLFMTELLEGTPEDGAPATTIANPELEAIRALQYEGTRAEVAQNFREQGNEMARAKRWRDGREFYTKALEALKGRTDSDGKKTEQGEVDEEEQEKEKAIEEACYSNRALCNLSLQNYRSTLSDTASTLRLNPTSQKALYRSALALFSLQRLPLALDACEKGLQISGAEPSLLALRDKIEAAMAKEEHREIARKEQVRREKAEKHTLSIALKKRGIRTRANPRGAPAKEQQPLPDLEDAVIKLEHPLDADSTLYFPLLVLFPVAAQSDFVKSVAEDTTLQAVIGMILPPPWDATEGLYGSAAQVEIYAEKAGGDEASDGKAGLLKIGKKMKLGKVFEAGVEVLDGMVKIYVLPKGKAAAWVEEMKIRMGR